MKQPCLTLSDYLVPIIYKDQLDDVAEAFLERYYPETLTEPMSVLTHEVAKRMWLSVQEVHITKYCSTFGQDDFQLLRLIIFLLIQIAYILS